MRLSEEEYQEILRKQKILKNGDMKKSSYSKKPEIRHDFKKRHKYNAKKTERDGFNFDSQKEARYYDKLILLQTSGEIIGFFRQVPLHLPGNVTYRMDFLVFYSDGTCEGIEVKGFETPEWKIKKKLVAHHYPWFKLNIIK